MRNLFTAAAFTLAFTGAALANDADFTMVNKTGYEITNVYVSPSASKNWGSDILGRSTLDDGESTEITFPHGNGRCMFDIRVKYDDGDTTEWGNVNLCEYSKITLFWDRKNQTTRAVGE